MLIVTGTKRSGTSMWMQILIGAGFPYVGEPFSGRWEQTIKAANPDGFFESHLRRGIYYKSNPHPKTGAYLFPEQVQHHAVKVFIPGLVRSDRAFITKVIATVREWREYEASIARLYAMEDKARHDEGKDDLVPLRMPGALEWWAENFALVRDIAIRRYPVHVQSYEGLLAEPQRVVRDVLKWIGKGDADAALAAVKPENRTQFRPASETVEPEVAAVFDDFYAALHAGKGLSAAMLERLNKTNEVVAPRVADWQRRLAEDARRRRALKAEAARAKAQGDAPEPADEDGEPDAV